MFIDRLVYLAENLSRSQQNKEKEGKKMCEKYVKFGIENTCIMRVVDK